MKIQYVYEDDTIKDKDERTARLQRREINKQVQEFVGEIDFSHLDEIEDEDTFMSFEPMKRRNRR